MRNPNVVLLSQSQTASADVRQLAAVIEQHALDDEKNFAAMRTENALALHDVHTELQLVVGALGIGTKKTPIGLMGQKEWIWKVGGSLGGFLIIYKALFAMGPSILTAAKALAHLQ